MDYITLILYVSGILGICISIVLLGLKIYKKNKLFSMLTLFVLISSVLTLGSGTIFSIIDKKNSIEINNISNETPNASTSIYKESSLEDLSFEYKIKSTQTFTTITNNSKETFSGNISLDILNGNNNILANKTLSITNLLPNNCAKYNFETPKDATTLTYTFSGDFNDNNNVPYSIKSVGMGNDYLRFVLVVDSDDPEVLKNICNEYKSKYNISLAKGFLIYFVNNSSEDFDGSFAEYYRNNEGPTSNLVIYNTNKSYNI
ncbi:MAG: hypothetical protein GX275_03805 [Clostridiales bacterium]|nr:hypothetical protein [Clostridiales bacterium]